MELDDFKKAWGEFSTKNEQQLKLSQDDLRKILGKRTKDISERIARNIRIGIGIVLAWIVLGFAIDILATPLFKNMLDKPYLSEPLMTGVFVAEALIYLIIAATLIVFFIRYRKVEKANSQCFKLEERITQLISVVKLYKRMFYVVLVIVLIYVVTTFSLGFFNEFDFQMEAKGLDPELLATKAKAIVFVTFGLAVSIILGIYYLLFNLFFKRLYGRYLLQLKNTLIELSEAEIK